MSLRFGWLVGSQRQACWKMAHFGSRYLFDSICFGKRKQQHDEDNGSIKAISPFLRSIATSKNKPFNLSITVHKHKLVESGQDARFACVSTYHLPPFRLNPFPLNNPEKQQKK